MNLREDEFYDSCAKDNKLVNLSQGSQNQLNMFGVDNFLMQKILHLPNDHHSLFFSICYRTKTQQLHSQKSIQSELAKYYISFLWTLFRHNFNESYILIFLIQCVCSHSQPYT